jgi:E3 ubiquitin-protein ligase TRIP12
MTDLPTFTIIILDVQGIVHKKQKLEKDPKLSATEKRDQLKLLTMDGCPIEDLGLDFTLPGYPNIGKNSNPNSHLYRISFF